MSRNTARLSLRVALAAATSACLFAPVTPAGAEPATAPSTDVPPAGPAPLTPSPSPAAPLRSSAKPPPLQSGVPQPDPVKLGGFRPKPGTPPTSFLREGSFVFERPGHFSADEDGKSVIRFDPPAGAGPDARPSNPLYVLPNLKRMALEDALKGRSLPLLVSGTVTDYDGHNYLLLDDTTRPAGPPATAPAAAPATRPAAPARELSSDQLMGQLLRPAPALGAAPAPEPLRWEKPPATDRTTGAGSVKPGSPPVTVMREGRYLTDRLGRLTRAADGKTAEFVLEADGRALRDPPLVVMPCTKLLQMQAAVVGNGRDVRFRLSGVVTEYRGRNYVLPEKAVVMPDAAQSF